MKKFTVVAKALFLSTLGLGIVGQMPSSAASIVPQQEGQIQLTNTPCITSAVNPVNCIDTTSLGYTVTSLPHNPNFQESLLFSDNSATANKWGMNIEFDKPDIGTNPTANQYVFRPVAVRADGTLPENGQLEVGQFLFDFMGKTINEVKLNFFDVEDSNFTSILLVNGNPFNQLLPGGANDNIQSVVLKNVQSFQVQLGRPFNPTGDGVNLQVSVPEPGTTLSMSALAVAGMFGFRQRKKG